MRQVSLNCGLASSIPVQPCTLGYAGGERKKPQEYLREHFSAWLGGVTANSPEKQVK